MTLQQALENFSIENLDTEDILFECDCRNDSDDWEEHVESRKCTKRIWVELNEDGEVKDDGVLTEEQLQ